MLKYKVNTFARTGRVITYDTLPIVPILVVSQFIAGLVTASISSRAYYMIPRASGTKVPFGKTISQTQRVRLGKAHIQK